MSAQSMFATEGILKKPRVPKEFLGAFKVGHRHAARECIDEELSEGLLRLASDGVAWAREALEWLTKFNNEYYKCVFTKNHRDLIRGKKRRKERYSAQNARFADVLAKVQRAEIEIDVIETESEEDALIALIDLKREMDKSNKQ